MIYFMQPVEGGPVKIGFTDDLGMRHKQLEAHYGRELVILSTMPGGKDKESEIHAQFDHLRFKRRIRSGRRPEQFRPTPELMEFIGLPLLVDLNPDTIEAMPGRTSGGRPVRLDLDPDLHQMLRVVAAEQGKPMAVFAREVVEQTVRRLYAESRGR